MKPPPSARLIRGHRLAQGLICCLSFSENGGLQVFDSSENGYDGTLTGGDVVWSSGKFGSCLSFPGTAGDYVNCGTNLGDFLGTTNKISVSIWFQTDVTSGNDGLFTIGDLGDTQGELVILLLNNNLEFRMDNEGYTQAYGFTDTGWNHLIFSYDGVNGKAYLNGVEIVSAAYSSNLELTGLVTAIGTYYDPDHPLDGKIDNVMLWNRGLSASEASELCWSSFHILERKARTALMSGYAVPSVGNAGIMTPNTGFWGPTF